VTEKVELRHGECIEKLEAEGKVMLGRDRVVGLVKAYFPENWAVVVVSLLEGREDEIVATGYVVEKVKGAVDRSFKILDPERAIVYSRYKWEKTEEVVAWLKASGVVVVKCRRCGAVYLGCPDEPEVLEALSCQECARVTMLGDAGFGPLFGKPNWGGGDP